MEKAYDHLKTEIPWYEAWMANELFKADNTSSKPVFSMTLPPPNVTGSLHMGHALTFTIPDIINRRKIMQGYNALWLPGLDHAGIATQMVVEKDLKKSQNLSKEDLGREEFLKIVWDWKETSEKRIVEQIKKLGLSLDWSRKKFTLEEEMKRVVTRVFTMLYREEKIYRGIYMVNRCPSCKTVLSDLEVEHREIQGRLTTIKYPLQSDPTRWIAVATTRPETMLGDTAVAVHPDDSRYRELVGQTVILPIADRPIPVIADSGVEQEFGTGAVKITPAHDPNDYEMSLRHRLDQIEVIDEKGNMHGPIPERFIGMDRFSCRRRVLEELKEADLIIKEEDHPHSVGHCQRCETIVEPNISEQWFLKMKDLAQPAIAAVREKKIRLIPEKWEKVYFNWMENIQDWCISRQLWWGHRIPAYYCQQCGEVVVTETAPDACTACRSDNLRQDEDVLDTWFSSALWPFSTLGWIDNKRDFQVFYPTSLMATGFDIIFFWVARMIVMGLHFGKDIPFREVLINGLIRDEKGRKMSKTKGNAVDPLDLIERYGADALRFTLAIQAVPGMDISLSISRIKGYRAFANKIWNASRFVLMNLTGDEDGALEANTISVTDKWFLHALNTTVDTVNTLMDEYRIYEAADKLYHFFWHEFCDWYLEFSKQNISHSATRNVLKFSISTLLQMLHPFMPHITEEIYHKISGNGEFLLHTRFPAFRSDLVYTAEFNRVESLKQVVMEARKTRTENRIDPNQKVAVFLKSEDADARRSMHGLLPYFELLTRSSRTEIRENLADLPRGYKGVTENWEILLPFESDDDRKNEIQRLQKEQEKLLKQIKGLESKLKNSQFLEKAPDRIIDEFKQNLQEALTKRDKLASTLIDLSD